MSSDTASLVEALVERGRSELTAGVCEGRENALLPSLDSLISCGVRRIAYVMSRPWRPEIKVPAGDRSGRRSVGLRLRVQNIASVQLPRNGDRNRRRLSGRGRTAVQWPVNPGVRIRSR